MKTWPTLISSQGRHRACVTESGVTITQRTLGKTLLMQSELSRHEFGLRPPSLVFLFCHFLLKFCLCFFLGVDCFMFGIVVNYNRTEFHLQGFKRQTHMWMYELCVCVFQPSMSDERRGSRPRSMVRSFTMPSSQRPLSVASVTSISSDNSPSRPGSDGYTCTLHIV